MPEFKIVILDFDPETIRLHMDSRLKRSGMTVKEFQKLKRNVRKEVKEDITRNFLETKKGSAGTNCLILKKDKAIPYDSIRYQFYESKIIIIC